VAEILMIVSSGRCKRQNYILNQKSLATLQHDIFKKKSLFMSTNGYSIFNISYCFQRYPSCVDNIQSFMLRITFVEKGQIHKPIHFVTLTTGHQGPLRRVVIRDILHALII
jgi:hypothetical protein